MRVSISIENYTDLVQALVLIHERAVASGHDVWVDIASRKGVRTVWGGDRQMPDGSHAAFLIRGYEDEVKDVRDIGNIIAVLSRELL